MTETLKCIQPLQVHEEDYLTALTAEARPEFLQHLQQCQYCQQELAAYNQLDTQLHQQLGFIISPARALCPAPQQLGEFGLGMLGQAQTRQIKQHLESCEWCPAELTSLQTWLSESDPFLQEQPTMTSSKLRDAATPFEWVRRVVASLVSTGPRQANYVLAGVRGDSEGLPLTYQAEEVYITVTIQLAAPRSKDLMVLGLVQRDNQPVEATAGAQVRLSDSGTTLATEVVDELGNFVFAQVDAPSSFDLEITLDDKIVLVPNLSIN